MGMIGPVDEANFTTAVLPWSDCWDIWLLAPGNCESHVGGKSGIYLKLRVTQQ